MKYKVIGAIGGDIIGSQYEFRHKAKNLNDVRFTKYCRFTDDTVLTIAIIDYFNNHKDKDLPHYLKKWYFKYPNAGFGAMFHHWCNSSNTKPYNSFGNGSAMRVSPVAYVAKSLDECLKLAKETAEVTHNHKEGIKGAQAIAGATYLALTKHSKEDIFKFAISYYPILDKLKLMRLHDEYEFDVTCQGSVPIALFAFFLSKSYMNCLEIVNYIGGDTDTIGAMAGAISGAFYNINNNIEDKILSYLSKEMIDVLDIFNKNI